ncbi:hypothetical protein [Kaistia granuli]|jgi:hypothetical protein|uniref:hypothetical protein n=1 Tax=Kaistia granuli TaxID=363259 RepID=UPI0012EC8AC0|nr:hypothetical protein [Kaistia granuli]
MQPSSHPGGRASRRRQLRHSLTETAVSPPCGALESGYNKAENKLEKAEESGIRQGKMSPPGAELEKPFRFKRQV